MPLYGWAGKWRGGRYYLDERGLKVFVIESNRVGIPRAITLNTHDEELATGQYADFLDDPVAFCRPAPEPEGPASAVYLTKERLLLYKDSIHGCALDYRKAKEADLLAWANYRDGEGRPLDLRTADKRALRLALASFAPNGIDKRRTGGFKRRAESLNCFANFLVDEGDLKAWSPLQITSKQAPAKRRAERVAYSVEELEAKFQTVKSQAARDVLVLRASTGMHHTEIEQLKGCKVYTGPLPDEGVGIRKLDGGHEIAGVLQFRQKTKPRHRVSVNAAVLEAALRLRAGVPSRKQMYDALDPLVPSNLRHTWVTLCGELGEEVSFKAKGIPLDRIQAIGGHRVGSKITEMSYDKLQVPPMVRLPFGWG